LFDAHAPADVPRIMLCDTFCDEKAESLRAAECGAAAVRLDTPRSRRGDMRMIIEEVRWELDAHSFSSVKIFLSGGVTRDDVRAYRDIVDAFGIGGAIANAPVVDFSLDIVEIDGKPKAKRGKRSGEKQVYQLRDGTHKVLPISHKKPKGARALIERFIKDGRVVKQSGMQEARLRVLGQVKDLPYIQSLLKKRDPASLMNR
jgi:nicotinate phosphoribosyltransferase